ncbi:hypothetical protein [Hyalangium gracile]|uniref:hypothetical protein n=1 Tax=Hyalangium gracile TaxID=394092 RepID=UPI001CC9C72D|nr:hypothetical protein [Hyalangium gracile]
MAIQEKERREQEKPREAGAGQEPAEKKSDNADQAKEGMPGYGQPPDESRKKLPEQDW